MMDLPLDDPHRWLAAALDLLEDGVARRRSPWRVMTLATWDGDGPDLRSVTLRGHEAARRQLRFNLDRRSPKWAQMKACPSVALHGYDAAGRIQLRLRGLVALHGDGATADAAWARSQPMSRACYAALHGPGAVLDMPSSAPVLGDGEAARGVFGAAIFTYHRIDMVWLRAQGHVRVRIDWTDGVPQAQWVAP